MGRRQNAEFLAACREVMKTVAAGRVAHSLDEQAVPAYLSGNVLSRWVFWSRLHCVMEAVGPSGGKCLDFGCGTGILLPFLTHRFREVFGVDTYPEFARAFIVACADGRLQGTGTVTIFSSLDELHPAPGSLDLILALDVLEHLDDPADTLAAMAPLLKRDGALIVSGPTENLLYRLGRRLVGFQNRFHHHTIYDIERAMKAHFRVQRLKTLPPIVPLFHILRATRLSQND